jgi:hypothetical protein
MGFLYNMTVVYDYAVILKDFNSTMERFMPVLESNQPATEVVQGALSRGSKRPGLEADHSPQ